MLINQQYVTIKIDTNYYLVEVLGINYNTIIKDK